MKQHPVRSAFEHVDARASSEFRETLRAQLLADLVAPKTSTTVIKNDHPAQETIVTDTNNSPSTIRGRRAAVSIAAAVIVAIGVTAVVINRNSADTVAVAVTQPSAVTTSTSTTSDNSEFPSSQQVTVAGDALPAFDPANSVDPAVGQPAPLINGFDFQSNGIAVDPSANGPYMIVFLAHWCPHCNAEVPRLLDWKASGAMPSGLNVLGVATAVSPSAPNYPPSEWFRRTGWSWPVMVDESQGDGAAGKAAAAYGATGWPYIVIVGADGLVKARVSGEIGISDLQIILDDALAA